MQKISNNQIKELAGLKQKKHQKIEKKILVEGVRLIKQLLNYKTEFDCLICDVTKTDVLNQTDLDAANIPLFTAESFQIKKLSSTETPQPLIGVVKKKHLPIKKTSFLLYLDSISEAGNLGTIFRTAAALGIDGIVLSPGCCDIYNAKAIRASMGSVFSVPSEVWDPSCLNDFKGKKIATIIEGGENLYQTEFTSEDIVLIIGSEAHGIRNEILEQADIKLSIPMKGAMESLNAVTAAGIAMSYLKYCRDFPINEIRK